MIIPGKHNLVCNKGGRFDAVFRLSTRAALTSPYVPLDLSGKVAKVVVLKTASSPPLAEFTTGNGSLVVTDNVISIHKGALETDSYAPGIYIYKLLISSSTNAQDGDPYLRGQFRVDV